MTQLWRDVHPEGEAEHAKHVRIATLVNPLGGLEPSAREDLSRTATCTNIRSGSMTSTSWKSQAYKTTRRERDQVPHSRSARGIDSLISDARVTAETQQVQFSQQDCELDILVVVRRQASFSQTVSGSPAVAVHRQELRAIHG